MKRIFNLSLVVALTLMASACRVGGGPKDFRYSLVAYDTWPVFVFYRITPVGSSARGAYELAASNGGWQTSFGSTPIRNSRDASEQFDKIEFEFIWKEAASQSAYEARIQVALRDLKPDPISSEMGLLVFRFARGGDVQAVTYEPSDKLELRSLIEVGHACGRHTEISDPDQLRELNRVVTYWQRNGAIYSSAPEDVPSRCE